MEKYLPFPITLQQKWKDSEAMDKYGLQKPYFLA